MKQIDEHSNKMVKEYPVSILFSLFFVAFGFLFLKLYQNSSNSDYLSGAVVGFLLGIASFILNTKTFLRNFKKNKQIKNALAYGSYFKATIEGERRISMTEGSGLVCSAEINGTRHEFVSEPISYYVPYACEELGIKTITVYVNTQNPEEYVVDTREIEDRIVDLTKK